LPGQPFTIGSPKQLGEILFGKMGLQGRQEGQERPVFDRPVTVLEGLAAQGVESPARCSTGGSSKLKSTYTDSAAGGRSIPIPGRVHTSYSLVGAQTGRLSSTDPNLQNIPIRTEIGRQIRDASWPSRAMSCSAADYSQIELRLAAHMADVPR
jgi:DNA polymerase-1